MEQRIGAVIILIGEEGDIQRINTIISEHAHMILGRQGIPLRDRSASVISLVLGGYRSDWIAYRQTGKVARGQGEIGAGRLN